VIDRIGSLFKQYADIDRILEIARGRIAATFGLAMTGSNNVIAKGATMKQSPTTLVKIGVLADKAFSFYYPENLDALQQNGAQLIYIDSFRDNRLPAIDALYIGGGFPELYAAELEANAGLRQYISAGVESGLPVYAECAGLMYLCRSITSGGSTHSMCGVIQADVTIEQRPQGHGYVTAEVTGQNPFFPTGALLKGHEFHHSRLLNMGSVHYAYRITRGNGVDGLNDGIVYKNVLASYMHLHARGVPSWAKHFIKLAAARQSTKRRITVKTG
jgi:cobyrinic acid a,c-diamide synthase